MIGNSEQNNKPIINLVKNNTIKIIDVSKKSNTKKSSTISKCNKFASNPIINKEVKKEKESDAFMNSLPTLTSFGITSTHKKAKKDIKYLSVEPIKAIYKDDFNILEVHKQILRKFQWEKSVKLDRLKKKKAIESNKLDTMLTVIDRNNTKDKLGKIENEINEIESDQRKSSYLKKSMGYIDSYRELGEVPKIVSFTSNAQDIKCIEDQETQRIRHAIIAGYLEIAKNYIEIEIIREFDNEDVCDCCGEIFEENCVTDNGMLHCNHCNYERGTVAKTAFYKDTSRVNTSLRNNYEDKENFQKALMRYQGKQLNKLPANIFAKLDVYFKSYGLGIGSEIIKLPLDDRGRRGSNDKSVMYKALYDVECTSYYEDINLICHLYWGWELPDVSYIEDAIMADYDVSQRIYEQIKTDRKSCLNTQYRLYRHLRLRGHICYIDDFKIVKTRDIIVYHEEIWKQICGKLNWDFEPII